MVCRGPQDPRGIHQVAVVWIVICDAGAAETVQSERKLSPGFGGCVDRLRCGERSIRLRPVLDVKDDIIAESFRIMDATCRKLAA